MSRLSNMIKYLLNLQKIDSLVVFRSFSVRFIFFNLFLLGFAFCFNTYFFFMSAEFVSSGFIEHCVYNIVLFLFHYCFLPSRRRFSTLYLLDIVLLRSILVSFIFFVLFELLVKTANATGFNSTAECKPHLFEQILLFDRSYTCICFVYEIVRIKSACVAPNCIFSQHCDVFYCESLDKPTQQLSDTR